jgi:hypothetical protein
MCLQELHLKCRRVPADAARALTGPEVRGSEEFRWNCGFPTVVHIGEHNTTPLARGYRRGYFVTLQLALIEHSIVCKRLRIRPGEPSEDVPGLPGTSATVQRIGAHLANPNRYVFRQHPDFHQQLMLGGGISGGIGDSFRTDTPTHCSTNASRSGKCGRGSNHRCERNGSDCLQAMSSNYCT